MQQGSYEKYKEYAALVDQRPVSMIRDLLKLKLADQPLSLDEVEPLNDVLQALRLRRYLPRRAVAGGPRGARRGDEPPGRALQLRRGR